jgi:hypothetical protein
MPENPLCPSCGREMTLDRTLKLALCETEDVNVFACGICRVSMTTEDHLQVAGIRVH